jgi:hypothetical protein
VADNFQRASTSFPAHLLFRKKRANKLMKTLGMIGGLGPESTIDYYKNIIAMYRERQRDGSYP